MTTASEIKKALAVDLIKGDYTGTPANDTLDHIIINWHEGFQVIEKGAKFSSFESAHGAILKIYEHNKFEGMLGYDKLSFSIIFSDGEVYEGRLYISPTKDNPFNTKNVIGKHCVDFLSYQVENGDNEAELYLKKYSFEDIKPNQSRYR